MEHLLRLEPDIDDVFSYALHENGVPLVRSITVYNDGTLSEENLSLEIRTDTGLLEPFRKTLQPLQPNEPRSIKEPELCVHVPVLLSLTEKQSCVLTVTLSKDGAVLASESKNVTVYPYDYWFGNVYPDILAAFVQPNHPVVLDLLTRTAGHMEKLTGSSALTAYLDNDPDTVVAQVAAAYSAIQELNLSYAAHPASFQVGQRIRLPDQIIGNHQGNCIELSLLLASVLEAIGLNPIIILLDNHAMVGYWLTDTHFVDSVCDDISQIEKKAADGINEIRVVESTLLCGSEQTPFEDAEKAALLTLANQEKWDKAIDVKRARLGNVIPISVNRNESVRLEDRHEERDADEIITNVAATGLNVVRTTESAPAKQLTKINIWERKLLDLTLRNSLVSLKSSGTVPLLCSSVAGLEDNLSQGKTFYLEERPTEWDLHSITKATYETIADLGPYAKLIDSDQERQILHTWGSKTEDDRKLTKIYRTNKLAQEENGAAILYLSLGLLRWCESGKAAKQHYAPLLLVPVELVRRPGNTGYILQQKEEDAQINITILEYLSQNYQIRIDGLDDLPQDEYGVDVTKVFTIVRQAIMGRKNWNVIDICILGNFSFSQLVMWQDIHNGEEQLRNSKLVRNLIRNDEEWEPLHAVDTEPYSPVPLDQSQLEAVKYAESGQSFVLHGPPGTGKSQTITALIGNAIAKGKTVLFVAEKQAALEVVYNRLKEIGIDQFCLKLHSNKATKRDVLDQLEKLLNIDIWGFKTDYDASLAKKGDVENELNAYGKALHKQCDCGASVYELLNMYETLPACEEIRFNSKFAGSVTLTDMEAQTADIEKLIRAGKLVAPIRGNFFSFVNRTEYSQSFRLEYETLLDDYHEALTDVQKKSGFAAHLIPDNTPDSYAELVRIANTVIVYSSINKSVRNCSDLEHFYSSVSEGITKYNEFTAAKERILSKWNESVLQENISGWLTRLEAANKKILFKKRAVDEIRTQLQAFSKADISTAELSIILNDVLRFQMKASEYWQYRDRKDSFEKEFLESISYSQDLFLRQKEEWSAAFENIGPYRQTVDEADNSGKLDTILAEIQEFLTAAAALDAIQTRLSEFLVADEGFISPEATVQERLEFADKLGSVGALRDWITYVEIRNTCLESGLNRIVEKFEAGKCTDSLTQIYRKSVLHSLIVYNIAYSNTLDHFSGFAFNELITELKQINTRFITTTKEEITYRLTHRLPLESESGEIRNELTILRKAIKSGRRCIALRALFSQIPHILLRLCPCLLMSPISVAQYLPFINDYVDIVVFDEASQLPTSKAVAAIARAKSTVVVGDPKQMPPTSFFASKAGEEDNVALEDLDSILDDCLAINLPSCYLTWHYRSRHESLIAFSNQEYYGNRMMTFPSVSDRERRVHLVTVDGRFSRKKGRINEKEGQAIIKEILRRYQEGSQDSIGVITFNITQQEYIENLLQAEYVKDVELDKWANDRKEPLFVKNLENVQGDERDIIIFSICFGQSEEDGKISLNFGPINQIGGGKRLNVAVSRARQEMLVYSSMTADMIDLSRTTSKGVANVRDFLSYAQNGRLGLGFVDEVKSDTGITDEILNYLQQQGYSCHRNVGHSDFKIDLAVLDSDNPNQYLLGITVDGKNYVSTANATDRELAQPEILSKLRWNMYRVWSIDWWDHKERILDAILETINACRDNNSAGTYTWPVSEEITIEHIDKPARKPRKKQEKDNIVSSFDDKKRFNRLQEV